MRNSTPTLFLMTHPQILFLLLFASSLPAFSQDTPIEFERCHVSKGPLSVDAECAVLMQPENPEQANGPKVEIHIAKFPARTPEPASDAFTIIQGGPGMSSIDLYLSMRGVFAGIRAKRDILVIDQRGTGRSNMLTCEQDESLRNAEFDPALVRKVAEQCLAALQSDPRYYTTSIAVDDLESVRRTAGYDALTIYGVSYGTRVAQHYLRRYPASTRALILDGVADIGLNLAGSEIAVRSQQAFDRLVARCNADTACAESFGDVEASFKAVRERLQEQTVNVRLPHPLSGAMADQQIGEQDLLGLVRLMPYSTESLSLLPLLMQQAELGNYVPMAAQVLQSAALFNKDYAYAMNNAVVCSEDAPFLNASDTEGAASTYFGTEVGESMQALCNVWPAGVVDDDFREPFESATPVLLMSGETDPITPPQNAERAKQMFSNALHITVPAHGHGVIGRGCMPQLATEFVETASVTELAVECALRERAQPFFISPTGPTP